MASNRNNSGSTVTASRSRTAHRMNAPSSAVEVQAPRKTETPAKVTHDMIAARAYDLWKMRGGDAEQNWQDAELLLRAGK